jgi:hypothetical protein
VAVHAPPDFDDGQPLHLVLFAPPTAVGALPWLASTPAAFAPGEDPWEGWGLGAHHDAAGRRTLLIAPQFLPTGPRAWSAWFAEPAALGVFLAELLGVALVPRLGRAHTLDDVADLTLVGASAGGYAVATILEHSALADRVRSVVLLDGFYMAPGVFSRWLLGGDAGAPRRFVSIHGGGYGTGAHASQLAAQVRQRLPGEVAEDPRSALTEAIHTHRVTLVTSRMDHLRIATAHFTQVLSGLDLPSR